MVVWVEFRFDCCVCRYCSGRFWLIIGFWVEVGGVGFVVGDYFGLLDSEYCVLNRREVSGFFNVYHR